MSAAFLLGPRCPELAPGGLCRGKAPRGQLLARGPAALPQAPRWGWLGLAPLRSSAGAKPSVGPWGLLSFTPWGWAAGAELRPCPSWDMPGPPLSTQVSPRPAWVLVPRGASPTSFSPLRSSAQTLPCPQPPLPRLASKRGGGGARGGKPALAVGNAGRGVARLAATVEARRGAAGRVLPSARGTVPRVGQRRTRRAVGHGPWDVGPGRRGGGTGDVGRGRKAGRGTRRGRCGRRS